MRPRVVVALAVVLASSSACSSVQDASVADAAPETETETEAHVDASPSIDAPIDASADAVLDADARETDPNACFPFGAPGECMTTGACAAIGDHSSYAGYCAGPADVQCCIKTPNVADDPPVPSGWKLMAQADVTTAMTDWAVSILHDPATYPMFSTTTRLFGTLNVMARVEWHPPDFLNSVVHRGVTLYEPI